MLNYNVLNIFFIIHSITDQIIVQPLFKRHLLVEAFICFKVQLNAKLYFTKGAFTYVVERGLNHRQSRLFINQSQNGYFRLGRSIIKNYRKLSGVYIALQ